MNNLELKITKFILLSLVFVIVGQILIPLTAMMVVVFSDIESNQVYANYTQEEIVENLTLNK